MGKWQKKFKYLENGEFYNGTEWHLALNGIFHIVMFKIILRLLRVLETFSKLDFYTDASFKLMILFL